MRSSLFIFIMFSMASFTGCGKEEARLSTSSAEAVAAYNEGVRLTNNFYYAEAHNMFENAISYDSAFALAWARLAVIEFNTQNETKAYEHVARALELSAGATLREQLFVRMWERQIHFASKEAAVIADSLIEMNPDDPEPYVFRGQLFELEHNLDAAVKLYRKAGALDTLYAPAAMTLGYAYSALNEQEKALGYMERYIRLVPGAADPRASYADLLLRVGRYDDALEQYRQSLQLKPDYWYAINQIGNVYRILGRLNEAGKQFDLGFTFIPHSRQLEASHIAADAELEIRRGRYQEAIDLYTNALSLDSTNLGASYGMVFALAELKRLDESESMLERVGEELDRRNLEESQAMVGFNLTKAKILAEQGRLDEARGACEEALGFTSPLTRPSVFRQIAEIAIKQGAVEEALDACEEALSVNPNSPEALLTLTKAYSARKDIRMTHEIGNRLLQLWKDADIDFVGLKELRKLLSTPS